MKIYLSVCGGFPISEPNITCHFLILDHHFFFDFFLVFFFFEELFERLFSFFALLLPLVGLLERRAPRFVNTKVIVKRCPLMEVEAGASTVGPEERLLDDAFVCVI